MRKLYSLFLSVLFFLAIFSEANAQSVVEINGTAPLSLNSAKLISGGGAGFGFYTPPIDIIEARRRTIKSNNPSPLCLRFGGYFYFDGVGQRTFKGIPLLSGTGNANVNFSNSLTGINFSAKLSSSLINGRIIPYAEGFTGLRYFSSSMTITPDDKDEKSNSITISKTSGINFGATGGLLFRITDEFYIDTGVMWTHSEVPGEYVDVRSLQQIGNNIGYRAEKLPNDFLVFKLGVTGYIDDFSGGNGDGWSNFLDGLFDGIGSGSGSGNIGLIKF